MGEGVYDITYSRREPTMTYGIRAMSAAAARAIAAQLFDAPTFRARLERDLDRQSAGRAVSLSAVAPGTDVTLSQGDIDGYLLGGRRHATMSVTLQSIDPRGDASYFGATSFDCASALDALYALDELPLRHEDLHGDGWRYGDDLFHKAEDMGLTSEWDGPFEAYLEADYQTYLGERLLDELGSLDAVESWLSERSGVDLAQAPEECVPYWINETYEAAASLAGQTARLSHDDRAR